MGLFPKSVKVQQDQCSDLSISRNFRFSRFQIRFDLKVKIKKICSLDNEVTLDTNEIKDMSPEYKKELSFLEGSLCVETRESICMIFSVN